MSTPIQITNHNHEVIHGVLKDQRTLQPMILICNGYKSTRTHPAITAIANKLYKKGHTVFTFNYSKSAQASNVEGQVNDIQAIITHFVEYKEFIVIGGSFGALSATIGARKLDQIKKLITINGFFGTNELLGKTKRMFTLFSIASYFIPKYKKTFTYIQKELFLGKVTVPTLVIYAEDDEIVKSIQSKKFFDQLQKDKHIHILKNADHHLTKHESIEEVVTIIDSWITSKS